MDDSATSDSESQASDMDEEVEVMPVQPLFRTNKHLHPKVKEVIIQLCFWFKPEEVASFLDLHKRTVERIWKLYRETGSVTPEINSELGRPSTLDWAHGNVSSSTKFNAILC